MCTGMRGIAEFVAGDARPEPNIGDLGRGANRFGRAPAWVFGCYE